MKLHLPKLLAVALFGTMVACATTETEIENIDLTLSSGTKVIGEDVHITTGEYIGYREGEQLYTTFIDGKITESLFLADTKTGSLNFGLVKITYTSISNFYNLTIDGSGEVAIGGKNDGSFATLTAGVVTVSDDASLFASNAKVQSLVVSGDATVALHGGNQTNSDFSQGNDYLGNLLYTSLSAKPLMGSATTYELNAPKQTQVAESLVISGGKLIMGTDAISYSSKSTSNHYVNGFGIGGVEVLGVKLMSGSAASITQSGGDMYVYGDSIAYTGLSIVQEGSEDATMLFRDRLALSSAGTSTIEQSNDNATLLIGRLVNDSGKQTVNITQNGGGYIQLAYGTDFNTASTVNIEQNGTGTIKIGGGLDVSNIANTNYTSNNTTYSIAQQSGGTIQISSEASISASSLSVGGTLTNDGIIAASSATLSGTVTNNGAMNVSGELNQTAGTINVAANASMTASSVNVGGTFNVAEGGSLVAGAIKVTEGGTLINNGVISGSAPAMADADEVAALANEDMLIVVAGGSMVNYGQTDKNILVQDGGTLTLGENASVAGVEITGGNINVNGDVTVSGALTLTGGTVTFMEDAVITLADGVEVVIEVASIVVNLSGDALDSLVNGGTYTLFDTSADLEEINGTTMTFVTESGSVEHTVNYAGEGAVKIAPAVPEPTTATLSLLALAGLAARRRRK